MLFKPGLPNNAYSCGLFSFAKIACFSKVVAMHAVWRFSGYGVQITRFFSTFFVLLMLKMQFGSEHSLFFHSCCLKMHVSFVAFQNRSVKTAGGAGETTVYLLPGSRVLVSVGVVAVAAVATAVAVASGVAVVAVVLAVAIIVAVDFGNVHASNS